MDKIRTYAWILLALSGVLWAQNVISVEAFDEQGGNPGQMTLRLRVVNGGADTVEGVRLRYFLKYEKSRKLVVSPYYTAGAVLSVDTLGNHLALNIDIPKLSPGVFPNASGIGVGLNYADYGDFGKAGDFSYPGSGGFTETDKIPVYVDGVFYAGETPVGDEIPKIRFVGIQPEDFGTRSAWLELENFGTADVNLDGFYLKWSASDSVDVGDAVLGVGKRLRICGTGDSLECPAADVVLRKEGVALGKRGNVGLSKNGALFRQLVWNDSVRNLGGDSGRSAIVSQVPYNVGNISIEGIFIQKGVFFTLMNGVWVSHRAVDMANEDRLPSPEPFAENALEYDTSRVFRFAWHPVKNVEKYILTVKTRGDSVVYQETIGRTYADVNLDGDSYLWNVQNDDGLFSLEGVAWNSITKSAAAVDESHVLGVTALGVRKDTKMLVLNWGEKISEMPWDRPNETENMTEEESWRCWAVGVQMLNAYYGGTLTQDEIKFHGKTAAFSNVKIATVNGDAFVTRGEKDRIISAFGLGGDGGGYSYEARMALAWALNIDDADIKGEMSPNVDTSIFLTADTIQYYIDKGIPLFVARNQHVTVIDGYDYHDVENRKAHFLNTDNRGSDKWLPVSDSAYEYYFIPITDRSARLTDYRVHEDSDGDGIVDFDEMERFHTDPYNVDSDGDGVDDKTEIVLYTQKEPLVLNSLYLGSQQNFRRWLSTDPTNQIEITTINRLELYADVDGDGIRAELDVDSDGGGTWDGDELKDGTDPFDASDDTYQSSLAVVMTEWDAPADITLYSMDAMRVNDRTVCYDGDGYCKIASESGRVDFAVNVGVQSVVGDIYSRGGVWLRSLAQVNGDIYIYSKPVNDLTVNMQSGVAFGGSENVLSFADWPYSVYDKSKVYSIDGIDGAASLTVQSGEEKTLGDGDVYSEVKVESGGTLKIAPGEMRVGNLQLESGSSIELSYPGMKTVIWVGGKVRWRASIANEDWEQVARGFKLVQLSDADLFVEGDFAGTIHAARAKLVMGQTVKQIYGRFVANTLTIHQNSQVHRVDFDPIVPTMEVVWR